MIAIWIHSKVLKIVSFGNHHSHIKAPFAKDSLWYTRQALIASTCMNSYNKPSRNQLQGIVLLKEYIQARQESLELPTASLLNVQGKLFFRQRKPYLTSELSEAPGTQDKT